MANVQSEQHIEPIQRTNYLLRSGMGTVAAEEYEPTVHGPVVEESDEEYLARMVYNSVYRGDTPVAQRGQLPPTPPTGRIFGLPPGRMYGARGK